MKKTLSIVAVAALSMVSCKKNYTCECTTKDSSDPTYNVSATLTAKMKKSDAESWCNSNKATIGTITTSCELK